MERFSDTRATAWGALLLAPLLPVFGLIQLLPFTPIRENSGPINAILWSTEAALLIAYIVPRVEKILHELRQQSMRPTQGVEIFHQAEDLLDRVAEHTVGAEEVSSLYLSSPPPAFKPWTDYIRRLDKFLAKGRRAGLKSFRVIASVDDDHKAQYIIARAENLEGLDCVSYAFFSGKMEEGGFTPLGIHIVKRKEGYSCFIFPHIQLSGTMPGVLINSRETYNTLLSYFDGLWNNRKLVRPILEGGHLRPAGRHELETMHAVTHAQHRSRIRQETDDA